MMSNFTSELSEGAKALAKKHRDKALADLISNLIGKIIGILLVIFAIAPAIFYVIILMINFVFHQTYTFSYWQYVAVGILFGLVRMMIRSCLKVMR